MEVEDIEHLVDEVASVSAPGVSHSTDQKKDPFDCLPDELMVQILKNLDLPSLYSKVALVSQRFYRICKFLTGTSDQDPFDNLPNECILKIFSLLDLTTLYLRVSLVCHRFCSLAQDASLCKELVLPSEDVLSLTKAHEILDRSTLLTTLCITQRSDADLLAIYALAKCPNLRKLELIRVKRFSHIILETIDEDGKALKHLNLWDSSLEEGLLESHSICLSRLSQLELFNCRGLEDSGLILIADQCGPTLERFNIEEVTRLSDEAVSYFLEKSQKTLKHFFLDGESLSDKCYVNLAKCEKLQTLKLFFAEDLKSNGLRAISTLQHLTVLTLSRAKLLIASDFVNCFENSKLQLLTQLNLTECSGLTDAGMSTIASNCPLLETIYLDWCWGLTDQSVRKLGENCPYLEIMNLTGIFLLTNNFLMNICQHLPRLRILNLQQCPDIDDYELNNIVKSNQSLKLINYYGEPVAST